MLRSINDLIRIVDTYYDYLQKKNFQFDYRGFPVFEADMFLNEEPELVVP